MKVHFSSHLRHYTGNAGEAEATGATIDDVLRDLDRRFPGLRFRIVDEQEAVRPHMNVFVNQERVRDLKAALKPGDELHLLGSLSGG